MQGILAPAGEGSGGNKLGLPTTVTDSGYDSMNIVISTFLEETLLTFDMWHGGRESGSRLGRADY